MQTLRTCFGWYLNGFSDICSRSLPTVLLGLAKVISYIALGIFVGISLANKISKRYKTKINTIDPENLPPGIKKTQQAFNAVNPIDNQDNQKAYSPNQQSLPNQTQSPYTPSKPFSYKPVDLSSSSIDTNNNTSTHFDHAQPQPVPNSNSPKSNDQNDDQTNNDSLNLSWLFNQQPSPFSFNSAATVNVSTSSSTPYSPSLLPSSSHSSQVSTKFVVYNDGDIGNIDPNANVHITSGPNSKIFNQNQGVSTSSSSNQPPLKSSSVWPVSSSEDQNFVVVNNSGTIDSIGFNNVTTNDYMDYSNNQFLSDRQKDQMDIAFKNLDKTMKSIKKTMNPIAPSKNQMEIALKNVDIAMKNIQNTINPIAPSMLMQHLSHVQQNLQNLPQNYSQGQTTTQKSIFVKFS